ncbi:MAG: TolC family protein [Bacteroidota bacterium]
MKNTHKFKPTIMLLLLFPALQCFSQENKPLTIDDALEISYQNNPVMKQSQYLEEEREAEVKAARGRYFPQIMLSGNYQALSDEIHLDLNPLKDAISPLYETLGQYGNFSDVPNPDPSTQDEMPFLPDEQSTEAVRSQMMEAANSIQNQDWNRTIQEKYFGSVSARLNWPIFTGGKINAANKVAEIHKQEASQKTIQKKSELTRELITRYYGLRLANEVRNIRQELLTLMESHHNNAKRLYEEGMIPESEMLHAKVHHAEANRLLKKAERNTDITRKSLCNSLSVNNDQEITTTSKLFYLDSIASAQSFIDKAYKNNPQLEQISLKKQLAHQNFRVQRADYLPDAAITGMYDIYNHDLSPYLPEWMVGVRMQWNLFDGMARSNKVKAAKHKEDRVEQIETKAQEDLETFIVKLHQQLMMDVEQIHELKASAEYARAYLKVSRKSFQEGMSTSTDVTEASLALSKVHIEKLQVMHDYVTTLSRLLEVCGTPEEFRQYQHLKNTVFENEIKLTENE